MASSDSPQIEDVATAEIYLKDGIIFTVVKDHAVIDLKEAKVHSEAFTKVANDRAVPVLVIFGKMKKQTKEARDFFSRNPHHIRKYSAAALLVKNPLAKVFANFYLGINRPLKPTRMFTDQAQALDWLAQFKTTPGETG